MTQTEERLAIVAEARSWTGTIYHPNARVKGQGADCLTYVAGVFETLIGPIKIPYYPKDWHLNQREELYLNGILTFCDEVAAPPERMPLPGDIVLWKFGFCFAHGAIVTEWPAIMHSYSHRKCGADNAQTASTLLRYFENGPDKGKPRPRRFFTLKRWAV